jgi:hypothetical protein
LFIVESGETAIRGVGIYVGKELMAEEVKVITKFQESIWISIKLNAKDKVIVGCACKSPSSKQENLDELKSLMRNVSQMDKEYSHILIMGDFNYPKINWKQWTSSGDKDADAFLGCIRHSYLYQHVTEFTRTKENSEPSTLDLIFTNEEGMVDDTRITSPLGHSDHCVITFKFRCYFEQINTSTERWNFFKGNYDLMRNEMNIDWDNIWVDENSNKLFDIFLDKFNLAKQKSIPKINNKKVSKAKKHNYLPLDGKAVKKIRKKT